MSTKSSTYDNRLEIARKLGVYIAQQNCDSAKELLDGAIELMGKTFKCNGCSIYGQNEDESIDLVSFYKEQNWMHTADMQKGVYDLLLDTILNQQSNFINTESLENIYYIPIGKTQRPMALIFNFKKRLELESIELLESIGGMLSSQIEKITLKQQLREQYLSTVKSLVIAIEAKDVYTQGHSQRVARYSKIIGRHLKLKDEEIDELEITGLVHDIGKIGISDSLLTKPNQLTEIEFDFMKQHPEIGTRILKPLGVSNNVMMGTLLHHKRYDLKGYPYNFDIDKLPLVPAIIGVADAFDAMTSERTYKRTISKKDALLELKRHRGTQFDPEIVDVMEEILKSEII